MSKVLDEIRKIRKKLYEEEKGLTSEEVIGKIQKESKEAIKKYNLKLRRLLKNKPTSSCIKCYSFNEMEVSSVEYALSLTPEQRLDIAQYLREQFYKVKGIKHKKLNKKIVFTGNFNIK